MKCVRLNVEITVKKLKVISKSYSKKKKFEEYKKCLDGEKYPQRSDSYNIR